MTTKIDIAEDFSRHPAGRHLEDGPFSGELFLNDHLRPALKSNDVVEVILDGTRGFGSSFLEEAFGGIAREGLVKPEDIGVKLKLKSNFSYLKMEIEQYVKDATAAN